MVGGYATCAVYYVASRFAQNMNGLPVPVFTIQVQAALLPLDGQPCLRGLQQLRDQAREHAAANPRGGGA